MNSHISPGLGRTRLDDLEPRAVQGLYASMAREGYAHETRLVVHVTLKMALKQAVRWGLLGRNAAEMVEAPRDLGTSHSEAEEDFRHLTDAQAKILFFTFDLYGHLIPSAQGDVVRRLNASQERAETG